MKIRAIADVPYIVITNVGYSDRILSKGSTCRIVHNYNDGDLVVEAEDNGDLVTVYEGEYEKI